MRNDDLQVCITIVRDHQDNRVQVSDFVAWADVCELLSQHDVVVDKHKARMIIPCQFKGLDEDYEPALYSMKASKPGEVKMRDDGKPHIRRAKANVKMVFMLPLDIDGMMTIEEAKERFKEYEYFAYTSSGHRTARKNHGDAFRIFLPFSRPLTAREYELRDEAFSAWMGTQLDQSSTDIARGFFFPSYLAADAGNGHTSWRNEGKLLDPDLFFEREAVEFVPAPIIETGITADKGEGAILWNTLDTVGLFKALGLYKASSGGGRHEVICPWLSDHTGGDQTGTAIWERRPDRKGDFNCKHGHCKGKRIFDVTHWVMTTHGIKVIKPYVQVDSTDPAERFLAEMKAKREAKAEEEPEPDFASEHFEPSQLLELDNDVPVAPYNREQRAALLLKKYRGTEKYVLLYASEGFGKSYLAALISRQREEPQPNEFGALPPLGIGGGKVVFACKSNVQAAAQAQDFLNMGLRVQPIFAREYWLHENHKVEIEYYEKSHPWDYERVNDRKTIRNMVMMGMPDKKIAELWKKYTPAAPDFVNNDIIVTTQARVMGWGRVQESHQATRRMGVPVIETPEQEQIRADALRRIIEAQRRGEDVSLNDMPPVPDPFERLKDVIPSNAVIFCDDAHADDFCLLYDFDNKYAEKTINGKPIKTKDVGKRRYFLRPKEFLFGHGFDNQIIFSTTELLTREMIFARYGGEKKQIEEIDEDSGEVVKKTVGVVYTPELMPEGKLSGGKITMIKAKAVRRDYDGTIPVIVERIKKVFPDKKIEYIADAQGNKYNHITVKGQNSLSDHDIIVELSHNHEDKVIAYQHELGWEDDYKFSVRMLLALDTLHQAIGRNSGYRFSDRDEETRREAIVLAEPQLFDGLLKYMRYQYTSAINLDNKDSFYTRDEIQRGLALAVCWYVKHQLQYIKERQGQLFIGDVRLAFKAAAKPPVRKDRLVTALKNMAADKKITKSDAEFLQTIRAQVEALPDFEPAQLAS